uniref:ATP synthase complex subunit 8 n=2 Tax=Lethocerinae TaxID=280092 RepID=A0A6S6MJB3_9HEMI|nr:ATP synthase F0 subunit 8 [Lethocerus deyrollei]AOY34901.1 ATP synthase F0 subunit 8 [Lethocerus deyrollei]BCH52381.1 ATP synthase FO subunit 8 [Kirkaldyia deyrolli]
MPQMSPLWWSTLFIMFISLFMVMCTINYFMVFYKKTKKINQKMTKTPMNWKW